MEARAALSRLGMTNLSSSQSPVKMDITSAPQVSGPPTSVPPGCLPTFLTFIHLFSSISLCHIYQLLIIHFST